MITLSDNVLCKVAKIVGGEDAVKVIQVLKELGATTDDQILSKTELKLNDVRKILFKLYNHSIVQCDRSRDKDTGWFIFRWRLQPDQIEGFINNQKRRILRILKTRLEYEITKDFYHCGMPDCSRVTFEEAVDSVFRCPNCGHSLQHFDNSELINVLKSRIETLENETN